MPELAQLLGALEAHYGPQSPEWPADPFLFLIWWHCGYPQSDVRCVKGWDSLGKTIRISPDQLLAASSVRLAKALKPGGMVPELRATRLREIAERVEKEFGGDLSGALKQMPVAKARASLKNFPGIADPGADRILLFAGISPVAAVPSNCPHVLVRIRRGKESANWGKTYSAAQEMIADEVPPKLDARIRAYLLLKHHGQQTCKLTNPRCSICPVASTCAYATSFPGGVRVV